MHKDRHPLAGKTVIVAAGKFAGLDYRLEDWWDHLTGKSWGMSEGNPAALEYAMRGAAEGTPLDDEVVYGKIGTYGKLIHVSQLGEVMHTNAKLAAALTAINAPGEMIDRARAGYYHDFMSPLAFPEMQLVGDLAAIGTKEALDLRNRVIDGDFDASLEESEEWAASEEGQAAFNALLRGQ